MTKHELSSLAEKYQTTQWLSSEINVHVLKDAFLAGFKAGRDASAELADRSNHVAMREAIKSLGEADE